jgi:hypothetical protein
VPITSIPAVNEVTETVPSLTDCNSILQQSNGIYKTTVPSELFQTKLLVTDILYCRMVQCLMNNEMEGSGRGTEENHKIPNSGSSVILQHVTSGIHFG